MRYLHRSATVLFACFAVLLASRGLALDYVVERVASGLAQPDYVAQAPGDPANIIYYSTRCMSSDVGGFNSTNHMGSIFRYDMNTRTSTEIMNLNYRTFSGDEGLVGFAFSPDFKTPGAPGYQKLYVSSSQAGATATERVEEYVCNGPNGTVPPDPANMNHAKINSTVLQYNNIKSDPNHTIDWIGFDPTTFSHAVGTADRNYLYISCGDGDIGGEAQNRPEQKANSVLGKLLRVDVDVANHGDEYPPLKNGKDFAIPPTNPIPLWNAAHPNQQLIGTHLIYTGTNDNNNTPGVVLPLSADYGTAASPALKEIYFTGTRNQFRMSIDRQTGDFWMGDVGENTREEVNFLKAGTYNGQQPPIDFGYASREGTLPTQGPTASGFANAVKNSNGATTLQWNLLDGNGNPAGNVIIDSTNPIQEGSHTAGRSSYIGGYMYRGPIASLQGKYFWSDYVTGNIFQLDNFDPNTPLANYSGTNFNQVGGLASLGTRSTVLSANTASLWQSLTFDRTDATYTAALQSGNLQFGVGRAVSFGEDNAGNVYIIDFGGNRGDTGFGNDYPPPGRGEVFKLVPVGDFDRDGLLTVADISSLSAALGDLKAYESISGIAYDGALVKLGDVNVDGAVTNADVQALIVYLANHGGGSGSLTAVPEPASCGLLAIGGALLMTFARNRPGRHIRLPG